MELMYFGPTKWQNCANGTLRCIFFNKNFCISNKNSLKYAAYGLIDNKSALAEVMAPNSQQAILCTDTD